LVSESNWLTNTSSVSMTLFMTSMSDANVVALDLWIFSKILRSLMPCVAVYDLIVPNANVGVEVPEEPVGAGCRSARGPRLGI
jgi:hypothetical protein